jgi:hypothetical protein
MKIDRLLATAVLGFLLLPGASGAATVSFAPANSTWTPGATFSLTLVGTGFEAGNLDGGGLDFSFDPDVLQVTSVVVNTTDWEFFSDPGVIDNTTGTVTGISFNSFALRTGSLLFATVNFLAIGGGLTALHLAEYGLNPFATGGGNYPGLVLDQSASVAVVPLPPAATLLAWALVSLCLLRRSGSR